MLDLTTRAGAAAARRLETELIVWLTTVTPDRPAPEPRRSGSCGRDGEFLVYSLRDAPRIRNIAANPKVALNLNSDADGGDVRQRRG